ncbi:MAG: SMC-Scp complex subunit ScpB [Candidatus Thermoplasmatota archaeon]|nr:SMC-Scp complex subunit ScpB [Candidatus Thermoplasmatota archaeon]MEE3134363.1 SMC-Scp complex subunit ScpB [Candidatus Thermoplasmatota archaeon]
MTNELQTLIEATLFGAGKSMSVEQLSHGLKQDSAIVSEALHGLQSSLKRRRGGALQIVEISGKWALEVKPSIADKLPKEAKTDISPRLLKAAALIAYHQPMEQSSLVKLLGEKAYGYVKELSDSGLIDRRRSGNTRRLTTTRRFSEVFGCPHTSHKKVRMWFRDRSEQLGMTESELMPISIEEDIDSDSNLEDISDE